MRPITSMSAFMVVAFAIGRTSAARRPKRGTIRHKRGKQREKHAVAPP